MTRYLIVPVYSLLDYLIPCVIHLLLACGTVVPMFIVFKLYKMIDWPCLWVLSQIRITLGLIVYF